MREFTRGEDARTGEPLTERVQFTRATKEARAAGERGDAGEFALLLRHSPYAWRTQLQAAYAEGSA